MARKLLPGEKLMVERTLLELQQRDAPASVNAIRFHVGKMLNHWDQMSKLNGTEKGYIISDWEYALEDFSEGHVAEATATWMKSQRFKPAIADIVTMAENIRGRDRENVRRARVVLGLEQPRRWENPPAAVTPATDRPVAGLLASLADRLKTPAARHAAARSKDELLASRDPAALQKLSAMRKTEKAST